MRRFFNSWSAGLALSVSLFTAACGSVNDANRHLENMDTNTRNLDSHIQGIDGRMTEITSAVNNLTAQLAQMQTALQEVMVAALRVMFPPAGNAGAEFDLPDADDMGSTAPTVSTALSHSQHLNTPGATP